MNPQTNSGSKGPESTADESNTNIQVLTDFTDELEAMGLSGAVEIGRGGFGVVYRCIQTTLDRVVAVKVLFPEIDAEGRERFLREEQAMGRLSGHPNIVDILQVDVTATGMPLIVMPYCMRGSLERLLREQGPLTWSDSLRAGVKLAGAIESAHRARILHRDVKPANVLLSGYGEPQLTDFGISRIQGGFRTSSRMITGSPAFTAPEVLKGEEPTVRSDIYGLGATLFALLTGHAAFERQAGERVVAQFLRITTQSAPDLREYDIPPDVAAIVEKAMSQNPRDRPPSAYAFGEMLREAQRDHAQLPDEMALLSTAPEPESKPAAAEAVGEPTVAWTGSPPAVTARRSWPLSLRPAASPQGGVAAATSMPPSAATKFRPPTPTHEPIPRPLLLETLRAAGRRRLVVIHAPAGFGKSILAAQWRAELTEQGVAVAWLGIDRYDDNEIWFLAHLLQTIRRVRPDIGNGLDQMLEERPADAAAFVIPTLINEIHTAGKTIVVIVDDWHRVTDPGAQQAMEALLDSGCHHLRFVVTSREQTGLPTGRMRVEDELVEIGSAALRLTEAQVNEILVERNGFVLTPEQVNEIYTATDGWPAAIQLMSLSLRGAADPEELIATLSAGNHGIREYLAENVLATLEPGMLEFLISIAVTERVCGSLAAALSGEKDAEQLLEQAEQRELFLRRIEHDPEWFRMQPLFAEHLRNKVERTDPEKLKSLHRKASRWYSEHRMLRKAVDHALAATDLEMALDLLEGGGMDLIDASRMATLLDSVSKLPAQQVASRSKLLMAVARANVSMQQSGAARVALSRLSNILSHSSPGDTDVRVQRCQAAVLSAWEQIARDNTEGVLDRATNCLQHSDELPGWAVSAAANLITFIRLCEFDFEGATKIQEWAEEYHQSSRDPLSIVFGRCGLGAAAYEQLDITTSTRRLEEACQSAKTRAGPRSQAMRTATALFGELTYRRGDLKTADQLLDVSYELAARMGSVDSLIYIFVVGAKVKAASGDLYAAATRLEAGARIAADKQLPRLRAYVHAEQFRLGLPVAAEDRGYTDVVEFMPLQMGHRLTGIALLTAEAEEIAAIRALLAERWFGAKDQAVRRARALHGHTLEKHRPRAQLDAAILLAECLAAAGWVGEATNLLLPALTTCADLDWTRPLLDAGPGVVGILHVLRAGLPKAAELGNTELPAAFLGKLLNEAGNQAL
ncbi:protein kinase domain-containing protein [Nocardia sp. 004]|uniref:protein kinase domain-containing protein n=1 Tax=Nocardia sp. 004 TaxID=3385978 RepID=UPI00399F784A